MKKMPIYSNPKNMLSILTFASFFILISIQILANQGGIDEKLNKNFNYLMMPPDSSNSNLEYGDTLSVYVDGVDTIYILYEDTTSSDSISNTERLLNNTDIVITLGDQELEVESGIFGVHLENYFMPAHANDDNDGYYTGLTPSDYISFLAPKTLRYPGGSSSKFRHAFGSMNSSDLNNTHHDTKNGGYGISLEEIIDFYDKSDGTMTNPTIGSIISDMSDEVLNGTWLDASVRGQFEDDYREWDNQPHFDPSTFVVGGVEQIWNEDLYINDLIDLVEKMETDNPGLRVNVLYVVNIFTETAQDVKATVDYLRDESLNHQYSVNVVGVEIGNECANNFFALTLGFTFFDGYNDVTAFDHYYAYINGVENYNTEFGNSGDFALSDVLPTTMTGLGGDGIQKHNYLEEFKSDDDFDDILIGLPAESPNVSHGPFIIAPDEDQPLDLEIPGPCSSWNECLYQKYPDLINEKPAFDAVIPHLYFKAQNDDDPDYNTNWGEIPIGNPGGCLDGNAGALYHQDFPNTLYSYGSADSRLACAFDNIVTTGTGTGNFREFLTTRQKNALFDISNELHFDSDEPHPKECWITEWNLKNNSNYLDTDPDKDAKTLRRDVYLNSFVHSYLLQEELLNWIKLNYHTDFRDDFITYATLQNFLGGTNIDLMNNSNDQDMVELSIGSCTGNTFHNFVPRTTFHSFQLLNPIVLEDLSFLKSTQTIYVTNYNRQPSIFTKTISGTSTLQYIYVYFTNVKSTDQTYIVRPGTLTPLSFSGMHAEIHCVAADQLYSRSGKGALFDINDAYDACNTGGYANQFEIQGPLTPYTDYTTCPTNKPSDAMCVTVPPFSCGYFVFSFDPGLRTAEVEDKFALFPNPASTSFIVKQVGDDLQNVENLRIEVYNMYGALLLMKDISENESVDISQLPVGVYTVIIKADGIQTQSESLIKMK